MTPPPSRRPLAGAGVVVALAVGAFSYVTTENLPIGLLPLIAGDLRASPSAVGLLVTGYGLTVAVGSVPLTRLVRRVPRRTLLAALLAVFVVANVVSAAASGYAVLLAARVGMAVSQAMFWPVVAPTAASLFPPQVRGRVIATVFAGGSLATVAGVPAGTWLGQQAGWRVAFLALSGLGLAALLAVVVLLPDVRPGEGHAATGATPDRWRYRGVLAITTLSVTGVFTAYTYTVVFLTRVGGFSAEQVVTLLLVQGLAGLVGVVCVGALVDRWPRGVLAVAAAAPAAALLGLFAVGHVPPAATVLVALAGFGLAFVPTATQHGIMQFAPGGTDMASAWNGVAFNVGIGGGALIGGLLLDRYGVRSTALVGGLIGLGALAVLLGQRRPVRRVDRCAGPAPAAAPHS